MARRMCHTCHFKTWGLRKALYASHIGRLPTIFTRADWFNLDMPVNVAVKWLSICSFGKPRLFLSCITKLSEHGTVEIEKIIGSAAVQGHSVVNTSSCWHLLGWKDVNQRHDGNHITFAFHAKTAVNSQIFNGLAIDELAMLTRVLIHHLLL